MKNKLIGTSALALLLSLSVNESKASMSAEEYDALMGSTPQATATLAKDIVTNFENFDGYVEDAREEQFVGGVGIEEDVPTILGIIGGVPGATITARVTGVKDLIDPASADIAAALLNVGNDVVPGAVNARQAVNNVAAVLGGAQPDLLANAQNALNIVGGADLNAGALADKNAIDPTLAVVGIPAAVGNVAAVLGGGQPDLLTNAQNALNIVGGADLNAGALADKNAIDPTLAVVGIPAAVGNVAAVLGGGQPDLLTNAQNAHNIVGGANLNAGLANLAGAILHIQGLGGFPAVVPALPANPTLQDVIAWINGL